jgi:photosystem II stability/assembly factor-like uncharacterized protein
MRKFIIRLLYFALFICILFCSSVIAQNIEHAEKKVKNGSIQDMLDLVSADSIAQTIQDLANCMTRYEYTSGRREAAQYLFGRFHHYSQEVSFDSFQYTAPLFALESVAYGPFTHATFSSSARPSTLWITGDNGLILKSTDRGKTWNALQCGVHDFITHICFIDSLKGWCTGNWGNIYRTTDAGINWTIIPIGTRDNLDGITFTDSLHGWVIQNNPTTEAGKILTTQDGGLSWNPQLEPTDKCAFWDLTFSTPDSGFAIGWDFQKNESIAAFTFNAGLSWSITELSRTALTDMDFIDSAHGWSSGYNGASCSIFNTTDGGRTWSKIYTSNMDMNFTGIDFTDPNHGWASELWGWIFQTRNGGKTWQLKKELTLSLDFIYDVASTDSNSCMVLTGNQIHRTTDGGSTWESFSPAGLQSSSENVVAVVHGTGKSDSVVIIGAHYDCFSEDPYRYAPGANDNASGVAGVLELARIFSIYPSPYTLEFVAFSAEEHEGIFGSKHYAENAKASGKKVKAMINFDRIGLLNRTQWSVQLRCDTAFRWLADLAADMSITYTKVAPYKEIFKMVTDPGSDYYSFFEQGYPTISIEARWPTQMPPLYHHTTKDELAILTIPYEAEIVKTALATVAKITGMITGVETRPLADIPDRLTLYNNYPNPFNPNTTIEYRLPKASKILLKVYNTLGQVVAVLVDDLKTAGDQSVVWDGTDMLGNSVGVGIYLFSLQAGSEIITRKMILLR